jgi:hypothetical protein
MFNIDPLPVVAAVTATAGIVRAYYKSKSSDNTEGCNGHHWEIEHRGSKQPLLATAHANSKPFKVEGQGDGKTAVLHEAVQERCEDCNNYRYAYKKVFTVDMIGSWEERCDADDCRGSE